MCPWATKINYFPFPSTKDIFSVSRPLQIHNFCLPVTKNQFSHEKLQVAKVITCYVCIKCKSITISQLHRICKSILPSSRLKSITPSTLKSIMTSALLDTAIIGLLSQQCCCIFIKYKASPFTHQVILKYDLIRLDQ